MKLFEWQKILVVKTNMFTGAIFDDNFVFHFFSKFILLVNLVGKRTDTKFWKKMKIFTFWDDSRLHAFLLHSVYKLVFVQFINASSLQTISLHFSDEPRGKIPNIDEMSIGEFQRCFRPIEGMRLLQLRDQVLAVYFLGVSVLVQVQIERLSFGEPLLASDIRRFEVILEHRFPHTCEQPRFQLFPKEVIKNY